MAGETEPLWQPGFKTPEQMDEMAAQLGVDKVPVGRLFPTPVELFEQSAADPTPEPEDTTLTTPAEPEHLFGTPGSGAAFEHVLQMMDGVEDVDGATRLINSVTHVGNVGGGDDATREFTDFMADRLARNLGMTPDQLLTEADARFPDQQAETPQLFSRY